MPVLLQALLSRNPKVFRDKSTSVHILALKIRHLSTQNEPLAPPEATEMTEPLCQQLKGDL